MRYPDFLRQSATAAALVLAAAPAHANEIAFQSDYTSAWQAIDQHYGSIVGQLDTLLESDNGSNLAFWPDSYSNRPAAFSLSGSIGHITLTPLNGLQLRLDGFFLGGWYNTSKTIAYKIDNFDTPGLDIDAPDAFVDGTTGLTVTPAMTSLTGIKISFGPDGYNGGINNIQYTLQGAPVPEPETWAMLAGGLGLMGWRLARRKQAA